MFDKILYKLLKNLIWNLIFQNDANVRDENRKVSLPGTCIAGHACTAVYKKL